MRWYQHDREIILNYIIFICCDLTFILCTNSDLSPRQLRYHGAI